MATERLRVILEMVTGQYTRAASDAATATSKIAQDADRASTAASRVSDRLGQVGQVAKTAVAGAAVGALAAFTKGSIEAAQALQESVNAVENVFDDASDTVLEFGRIASQVSGLSAREFNQLSTTTGALLTNMGFGFEQAGDEAIRLSMRAADLASIFDKDVSQALDAINAGLRGETEPLRQFGVQLSDAAIRARAVEMGLADTTAAVDQNGKAVAALELIYEQTAFAQGDFIRTSDDAANAARVLAAEFENAQASFGQNALGAKNFFTAAASDFLGFVNLTGLFGQTAKDATKQAFAFEDAVWLINEALRDAEDPSLAFQTGLFHIAEEAELTGAQIEALAAAAGVSITDVDSFATSLADLARDAGYSEDVIEEVVAAILETGDAADDTAPRIDQLTGYLAMLGEAQRQFNDALAWFNADGAPNAARWLKEVGIEAADSVEDVLRLKAAFEEAGFAAAELAGAPIFEGVRTIGGGGGTGPQARAHGGPVSAGELYRVGEGNRPEMLMIPGDNGRVFSNAEMRSLLASSAAGGDTQNNYVTVPDAATAHQYVALSRSNRHLTRGGLRGGAR